MKRRFFIAIVSVFCFSWILGLHRIKFGYSPTFDFSACDYLCGTSYLECFEKDYTVIVYRSPTENPTFQQMHQFYVKNKTLADYLVLTTRRNRNDDSDEEEQNGKRCYIKDINQKYSTLKRHRKCAVIGNSGILLDSHCGGLIDSYDFVIRANMAPVEGYSSDVGHKTDLMLVNDETLSNIDKVLSHGPDCKRDLEILATVKSLNDTILWYPKDTSRHIAPLQNIAKELEARKLRLRVGYSLKDIYSNIKWKYKIWRYPSSGLYMLALAEAICQRTTVFGFFPYEKDNFGRDVLRHYYERNLTNFKTWAHNFDAEYHMLLSRRDEGLIEMISNPCVPKPPSRST